MERKYQNALSYVDQKLFIDSTSLYTIAKQVKTPCYLYHIPTLKKKINQFLKAQRKYNIDAKTCYALKANPNSYLIQTIKQFHIGADIVSAGELKRAIECGITGDEIVFSGVGKTEQEISLALENNIYSFNVESIDELLLINQLASSRHKKARVGFRFNPEVEVLTHKYISTGSKAHKFGMSYSDIHQAKAMLTNLNGVEFVGLSIHIGSQLKDLAATQNAFQKLIELYKSLNMNLEFLDIGGGLGVQYHPSDIVASVDDYMKLVAKYFNPLKIKVVFEPGRFLVANCGFLISKVIRSKRSEQQVFLIIDGGMNDFMRPSLYQAYHEILPSKLTDKTQQTDIVGPICESSDQFACALEFPELTNQDYIVICDAGAYGRSMSNSYNLRDLAQEYALDDNQILSI